MTHNLRAASSKIAKGKLDGRGARRTRDRRGVDVALEVVGRMLPDNRHVRVKLNLTGGLQAGKMPAMTNIARPGGIVGVRVTRQRRGRGNHEHGA